MFNRIKNYRIYMLKAYYHNEYAQILTDSLFNVTDPRKRASIFSARTRHRRLASQYTARAAHELEVENHANF